MAYSVAVVGATGAVGIEFLTVLEERKFPIGELRLLASARSKGKKMRFAGRDHVVQELTRDSFKGVQIALFSAGGSISKEFGPVAVEAGAVVIDNSSAFRMKEGVPLVVPEVNPEAARKHPGLIANPNCSTIIMNVPVWPLHKKFKVRRMVISTYQAISGAGALAMSELEQQIRDWTSGKPVTHSVLPHQALFNVFSHNSKMQENGYNEEENKMVNETRKIFAEPNIRITTTCVRVPVMRAHSEAINIEFERPVTPEEVREVLSKAPGVKIVDDRANNHFPMPLEASNQDDVLVGRIRQDLSRDDGRGIDLFVSGDQLRKGAASNAIQIAEVLFPRT